MHLDNLRKAYQIYERDMYMPNTNWDGQLDNTILRPDMYKRSADELRRTIIRATLEGIVNFQFANEWAQGELPIWIKQAHELMKLGIELKETPKTPFVKPGNTNV